MVVEGVASNKDKEIRVNANAILPIDQALGKWVEEVTWLIDPEHIDAMGFAKNYLPMEKRLRRIFDSSGIARKGEDSGLVAEADERFRMKITVDNFKEWRAKAPVRAARVKISNPNYPLRENMANVAVDEFFLPSFLTHLLGMMFSASFMTIQIKLRKVNPWTVPFAG